MTLYITADISRLSLSKYTYRLPFLSVSVKEEEVKKANRIILATKCSIIRDAQIAEKNEIAREFRNENLRLEKIMLEERDKALVEEELKREQERKNLLKYSKEIRKQLEERELIRAKEVERIEEEAIAMKKALDVMEKVMWNAGRQRQRDKRQALCWKNFYQINNYFMAKLSPRNHFRRNMRRRNYATRRFRRFAKAYKSLVIGANISKTWNSRKVNQFRRFNWEKRGWSFSFGKQSEKKSY